MRNGTLASIGSIAFALVATQHHALHMLLFTFGVGAAGMSLLANPVVRRSMLLMSLIAVGITVREIWRADGRGHLRLMGSVSAITALSLVAWSVSQFGI